MKKTIITLLVLFTLVSLNAQQETETKDYKYFIGGSFNFSFSTNANMDFLLITSQWNKLLNSGDSKYFGFDVNFGKQINTNWSIGTQVGFKNYTKEGYDIYNKYDDKINGYNIGLFARYVFNPASKFNFYFSPNINYEYLKSQLHFTLGYTDEIEYTSIAIGTSVGALYQLSERFNATVNFGGLYYVHGTNSYNFLDIKDIDFSYFGLNINMTTIFIGFEYKF